MTRLLRAGSGVADLDGQAARDRAREQGRGADPQDLLLLDDQLGIADPEVPLPASDPDARRRRLTALINTASLARTDPALFIIEDAHWIDAVSESMRPQRFIGRDPKRLHTVQRCPAGSSSVERHRWASRFDTPRSRRRTPAVIPGCPYSGSDADWLQ